MRALSVKQPWISLIARREKIYELRSWRTPHRGPLLLCASATPHRDAMNRIDLRTLDVPLGQAVCIVDVVDVRPATSADARLAWSEPRPCDFVWEFANARPVDRFAVKGKLSLYDVPDRLIRVRPWVPVSRRAIGQTHLG